MFGLPKYVLGSGVRPEALAVALEKERQRDERGL